MSSQVIVSRFFCARAVCLSLGFCLFWMMPLGHASEAVRVACLGDSITQGARVASDQLSYPAQLGKVLGNHFEVRNFGLGGATLIRSGSPSIWSQLDAVETFDPHVIIVALGTNDTVEGKRKNWSRIGRFETDCRDLLDSLLNFDSSPIVWLAGPTPMVLETPGLSAERLEDLRERQPRLEQLRALLKKTVHAVGSKRLRYMDLWPVLRRRPELLTQADGVHPNAEGYRAIALRVASRIRKELQDRWPTPNRDSWRGFSRFHFTIMGKKAWVVTPLQPAEGRPWIWRARFPGYHSEMDHQLLGHGFHLAFVDVAGLYGAPAAIEIGDALHTYLTQRHRMSAKPVLEAVSRGGLFAYHWALKHPGSVSAIYCDTPVCDPKSWPGGLGSGNGSPGDWRRLLDVYGWREGDVAPQEPYLFRKAHIIAEQRIPIMHIISDNDTVVPPQENTLMLKSRLESHGHSMELLRVSQGTVSSNGHHFTHPEPDRVVQFILRHAQ
jgi:lysophospholipase L1-like esterase/pimeloyl-ACP methyl ester carboxylesterase